MRPAFLLGARPESVMKSYCLVILLKLGHYKSVMSTDIGRMREEI